MREVIKTIQELNNTLAVPAEVYNTITGLFIVVVLLAMKYYKYTPSSKFRYAKGIYYAASISVILAILINRLLNYPPVISFSGFLYLFGYLLHAAHTVYAGSHNQHRMYGLSLT